MREEIATLDEAIPVYERDPRQGFHQECAGRMVTVEALREKRERLRASQEGSSPTQQPRNPRP